MYGLFLAKSEADVTILAREKLIYRGENPSIGRTRDMSSGRDKILLQDRECEIRRAPGNLTDVVQRRLRLQKDATALGQRVLPQYGIDEVDTYPSFGTHLTPPSKKFHHQLQRRISG